MIIIIIILVWKFTELFPVFIIEAHMGRLSTGPLKT